MEILAKGNAAKKWIKEMMYESKRCAIYPKGKDIAGEIKPKIPTINEKNIVSGIIGRTKIFAGKDTNDRIPVR